MTTTTRNRGIVIATLLLLLAVGGGVIYMHNSDTENINDGPDAVLVEKARVDVIQPVTPVPAPEEIAAPAVTQSTNTPLAKRRPRSAKRTTTKENDQLTLIQSETYAGNMPLIPLAVEQVEEEVQESPAPVEKIVIAEKETIVEKQKTKKTHGFNLMPEVGSPLSAFYNTRSAHMKVQGIHAGLKANIALGDHMALQPGVRYIMKGDKNERPAYNEGMEIRAARKLTLNYVQMPMNVIYKFGQLGSARLIIGAGPYVSYLASANERVNTKVKNSEGFLVRETTTKGKVTGLNRWDAGGGAFIGCQLPKGLAVTGGLEAGIINLQQNTTDTRHADNTYSFLLSVGYIIGASGKDY